MLRHGLDTRCPVCKKGTLWLIGRAGRKVRDGGVEVELPADFMIPTCDECGVEQIDPATAAELPAAIARARLQALRTAKTEEMDPIPD